MSLAAIAGTVCPTLGVVLCNALYFTPLTAALERSKKGSLGSLNPLPAALTVLSNIAWLSYGESAQSGSPPYPCLAFRGASTCHSSCPQAVD